MRRIVKTLIAFLVALVAFIGGWVWAFISDWEPEPIILIATSSLEIMGFIFFRSADETSQKKENTSINVHVNVGNDTKIKDSQSNLQSNDNDRTAIIDSMKFKTRVLFIDDDKNFNVVKILKDSGWKNTKTVIDIKSLDLQTVKEADILFVDINGVGKLLKLEYEGLDLALMLKQKYATKKVVIYSANKNSNSFHKAWDECDYKLEKNALPYQFQNLVEEYSFEFYNNKAK
jgi:hypothetical protein